MWGPILALAKLVGETTYNSMVFMAEQVSISMNEDNSLDNDEFYLLTVLGALSNGKNGIPLKTNDVKDTFKSMREISPDSRYPSSKWVNTQMKGFGFRRKTLHGYLYWIVDDDKVKNLIRRYCPDGQSKDEKSKDEKSSPVEKIKLSVLDESKRTNGQCVSCKKPFIKLTHYSKELSGKVCEKCAIDTEKFEVSG